jgi:DNA modification methylase
LLKRLINDAPTQDFAVKSAPHSVSKQGLPTPTNTKYQSKYGRHALVRLNELKPDPRNPRRHKRSQILALARSIEAFGFNAPILVDKNKKIVAGHARYEAAMLCGLTHVPVIYLDHLSEAQAKAYLLADNKLNDRSDWHEPELALHLKELREMSLDFEIEDFGFELPEIDLRIDSNDASESDMDDEFKPDPAPTVARSGDCWFLGKHRIYCGSALDKTAYKGLENARAAAVFTDPPYNVRIDGHAGGSGAIKHREFAMASGEMTPEEFSRFLTQFLSVTRTYSTSGALMYVCMDWRHMDEMIAAGRANDLRLINLCVWVKTNGGMGSFYRSQHELIFVFCDGSSRHTNNVQLGRFGRNRSNVWHYEGASSFSRQRRNSLHLHPTVKPIALVADALMDSTKRGDLILDPFLGSGTTLLACERKERQCYGIEIDPLYIDIAIRRWEKMTGQNAHSSDGSTFEEVIAQRRI